ncbi:hypothetical protein [Dongia sp.]|jgi:hypothetical protein|uniref:hypothetical protein n=1 Tax=Dongia sp. TaxID=1977262 RepID=UPI0035B36D66
MTATQAQPDKDAARRYRELCARAAGSNVNEISLLATDYLNHINEVIMLLEIVPDAPECLEDCKAWQPLEYTEHFKNSGIADKDLAIEAYPYSPPQYKQPFDQLVREMNRLIAISIKRLELVLAEGNEDQARHVAARASQNLQDLIGQASAIIHGDNHVIDQKQIDALMDL